MLDELLLLPREEAKMSLPQVRGVELESGVRLRLAMDWEGWK